MKELETKPMLLRPGREANASISIFPESPRFLRRRLETNPLTQIIPNHFESGAHGSVPGFHESREDEFAKDCLSWRRAADSETAESAVGRICSKTQRIMDDPRTWVMAIWGNGIEEFKFQDNVLFMIFSKDFRGEFLREEKGFLVSLILSLTNGKPLLSAFSIPPTVITTFLFISVSLSFFFFG